MKKVILFASILAIVVFTSCKKCTVCTYIRVEDGEEEIEEYCGSEKQVKNFEDDWVIDWQYQGGYCLRN